MDAIGVFNSWVTALMKLSCCSLRRISRTRKIVLRTRPATMAPKKMMPRKTLTPWRQLRMIQPLPTANATADRQTPSVRNEEIAFSRPMIRTGGPDNVPKQALFGKQGGRGLGQNRLPRFVGIDCDDTVTSVVCNSIRNWRNGRSATNVDHASTTIFYEQQIRLLLVGSTLLCGDLRVELHRQIPSAVQPLNGIPHPVGKFLASYLQH